MIYNILRFLVGAAFRVYFRKIYVTNSDRIPDDRPILFAMNHPTAFLDPMLIPTHTKHATHSILRGDMFASRFAVWFLKRIKNIPIFRFRDGMSALRQNQATFDYCYELLNKNEGIAILAEGVSKHEKRLRPIQKGTARMVFGAYEQYQKDNICVVPTSVNYSNALQFRSDIMLNFGEPIFIEDYLDTHQQNSRRAIKLMTEEIQKRMEGLVIHIKDPKDDEWINECLSLQANERREKVLPVKADDISRWESEISLVNYLNERSETEKQTIQNELAAYQNWLKDYKLEDIGVAKYTHWGRTSFFKIIIGFLPFLIGYVTNYIPIKLARVVRKKIAPKVEFYSSLEMVVGMVLYLIYFLILWVISLFLEPTWLKYALFALPVLGFFALNYRRYLQYWLAYRRFKNTPPNKRAIIIEARQQLMNLLSIPLK